MYNKDESAGQLLILTGFERDTKPIGIRKNNTACCGMNCCGVGSCCGLGSCLGSTCCVGSGCCGPDTSYQTGGDAW
jgi:hypothetical protein